eukprot:TRINITY_DN2161_c0_g1_i1.p1 TRINITY_DN2161_c0_g1~~TRINITY_DN2161_c0_g1_i1.p1  ORF type:complete len:148 (+),score=25.66 TRINITY_DN2161_c0_g1_i1:35-478(+)
MFASLFRSGQGVAVGVGHGHGTTTGVTQSMTSSWLNIGSTITKRFASKKQGGKSKNGRDSNPKYRGLKRGVEQYVVPGNIILRQKGTKWFPGEGCGLGSDFTIYAKKEGYVFFERKPIQLKHRPQIKERKYIHIKDQKSPKVEQDIR